MSEAFEDAYNSGERDAAARIIDFWGRPGAFASMPEAVQDYCRSTTFLMFSIGELLFALRPSVLTTLN